MAARKTNSFLFNRILSNFPKDMTMAFAYGSGVFKQIGNKDKVENSSTNLFLQDYNWPYYGKTSLDQFILK